MTKDRRKEPPRRRSSESKPGRRAWWPWLAAALVLTFAVYIPSLDNEFTNWDDDVYVTDNALLAHPSIGAVLSTPVSGNFHPLTIWSLALNYRVSGLNPGSYHWLSLLLHLANTALVFVFVRKLSGGRFWTTVVTSLFFGIHPMHVESVAWISERKDVLYAFFYLVGLILYLRYLDSRRWFLWIPILIAFVLSAASKPAAVVFPITLLAIDWYRKRKLTAAVLVEKAPLLAVSAVAGYLTLLAQKLAGAVGSQWTFFERLLFASYGTVMYVVKLFFPVQLSAIYPYVQIEGQGLGGEYYAAFAVLLVTLPLLLYLCRRVRIVHFGLAFFFINIALVLQFATVGMAVMADRYTYLPYIGLFLAVSWWLDSPPGPASAPGLASAPGRARLAAATVLLLLLPVSLVQTWVRCDVWQNSGTLWNDTIRKYPRLIYDAYIHRGDYNRRVTRQLPQALADFNQAIELNPSVARAWNFKGMTLAELNQIDSAAVCFDRALQLNPSLASALSNRGNVALYRGDPVSAAADFSRALALNPRTWEAYVNRALAYSKMGEHEKSIADLRQAMTLKPTNPENHVYVSAIAVSLTAMGRYREAIGEFDEAIRASPAGDPRRGSYYLNRSRAWLALGDKARALGDAREARSLGAAVPDEYWAKLGG